ncbi:MAG: branched-chain amino acid transport system II carrier protein [Actinomycetaceae bacterium]|nr:branched-chain amino acid transport system II carrier protein [Actinomycetaceae bacterium]
MTGKKHLYNVVITGLALFAMFFGAGNLIYPVFIGVEAGSATTSVALGFMATGVLLPLLAMVAAATSETGILGISERIGHWPGFAFCLMAFLSTGVLYAIPRVATVSYEMSVGGLVDSSSSQMSLIVYSFIFFAVTGALSMNPSTLIEKIGGWLTPALLLLLVVLITSALLNLAPVEHAPSQAFADAPLVKGILEGYNTLDAIASFVFGVIIITSLKARGYKRGTPLFRATALSGVVAGLLLGLVYFGLSELGLRIGDSGVQNGGEGLSYAARTLFGHTGLVVLGAIAILACLTTAVGLTGASTAFFSGLFPRVPRNVIIVVHMAVSFAVANLGLNMLLKIVVPVMYLCYPVTIALVIVCLLDIFIPGHMYWTYRGAVWIAAVFGLIDAASAAELKSGLLTALLDTIPLAHYSLGWLIPTLVAGLIGFIVDLKQNRLREHLDYDLMAREKNKGLVEAGIAGDISEN